jgi:hypothetical protein
MSHLNPNIIKGRAKLQPAPNLAKCKMLGYIFSVQTL